MKQYIVGGLTDSPAPACAGCLDGGWIAVSRCAAAWFLARLVAMSATAPAIPAI
jgi:hypothetical protein